MNDIENRIEANSVRVTETGCRIWLGTSNGAYGRILVDGKLHYVHRQAAFAAHGPIPEGLVVMHKCHTPLCTEPSHLAYGTQQENIDAKEQSGRTARGSRNGNSKLTDEMVRSIRADPRAQHLVAEELGVHQTLVSLVKRRKIWGHVA